MMRKIAWLEKDYLESNGYETRIVATGDKVIPELMQDSYDLLLLDIMLPGMSGYDICRKIREEIDIPILKVTARTESIDAIRGLGLEQMTIFSDGATVSVHINRFRENRGRRQKSQDHRNRLGRRLPAEPVTEGKFPAWETGRELSALVIFQEYLYILCEFVEPSIETIGSMRRRLSNKMYKYS